MDTGIKKDDFLPVDFDPFCGPEIIRVVPAIEPQLEIWVSCIMGGEDASRAYNESVTLRLSGTFDYDSMRFALRDLLKRHEALRSTFSADGKQICIIKELPLHITFADLSGQSSDQQQSYIAEFSKKDAGTSFDLLNGPLVRFAVLKISEKEHYLKISAHHIICDGWSLGIMLQDLGKLYSAYTKNETPHLPETNKFSQYAMDQCAFSETEEYKNIVQYWVDQYKGNIPVLNLPTDFPRPSLRTYKSQRDDYALNRELVSEVKAMGAKAGCSFVTTLLAAFEVCLHRLSGQNDIVLGLPTAGQSGTNHQQLVGHCVNLLPLKSHHEGGVSFVDYLKQRKKQVLSDYDHQQFTFGSLLKKLNIKRDPSRVPLVPVTFNIDIGLDNGVAFHGLDHKLFYCPREYENFEIFLNASGSEQALILEWSYNTQLFKPATIKSMMEEFTSLLHAIVADPNVKIKDIPAFQKQKIKNPQLSVPYPKNKTIVDLFSEQAKKTPTNTALIFENEKLSYQELDERSNQLAHYLKARNVGQETLVPICMNRSLEMIIGILGILKAGGAYVPIDPEYPQDRINYMLSDTGGRIAVCDASSSKLLNGKGKVEEAVCIDSDWKAISQQSKEDLKTSSSPSNLAYIIYTSGSTGRPKGVMIEHINVVRLFKTGSPLYDFNENDVWTMFHSFCFDFSVWEMYGALFYGGCVIVVPKLVAKDARLFGDLIIARKVTVLNQTPSAFYVLQEYLTGKTNALGVRYVIFGGEALNPSKLKPWKQLYSDCQLINMYGITETTVHVTYKEIGWEQLNSTSSVIGRPIPTLSAYILDSYQNAAPVGVPGELYIGGAGLARGYLNLPQLTSERFIKSLFDDGSERLYRTGDLAKWLPDGSIEYLGRIDDQVKIRGFRIELGEIETVLQQYPGVKHCVVTAVEDNNGDKKLIGYVVTHGAFNKDAITNWLGSKLPEYMVPSLVMRVDKIPLTSNGKVDKKALPEPVLLLDSEREKYIAPRTNNEKLVAGILAESLGLEKVSINDDFFELGGHSLIAVKVMKLLEEKTGRRLPITSLFEAPTVAKLSLLLDVEKKAILWKSLVPIKPEGNKPTLYLIHGSGLTVLVFNSLARDLDPDQPVYGLQAKGLNGENPLNTIEEMAAYYISEIIEQNPNGPYCLAGYSFGGLVAFEMAKQLEAMGKQVKTLAIFDTNANISDDSFSVPVKMKRKALRQLPKMKFIFRSLKRNFIDTILYQFNFFGKKIRRGLEKSKLVAPEKTEEEILSMYAKHINEKHDKAYHNYKLTPYNGAIDLFRVNKRLYYLDDPEFLGWKPYALRGLRVHEIPGDHKTFLLSPNEKELAKILQQVLDERMSKSADWKEKTILKAV